MAGEVIKDFPSQPACSPSATQPTAMASPTCQPCQCQLPIVCQQRRLELVLKDPGSLVGVQLAISARAPACGGAGAGALAATQVLQYHVVLPLAGAALHPSMSVAGMRDGPP